VTTLACAWNTRARDNEPFGVNLVRASRNGTVPLFGVMEVNGNRTPIRRFAKTYGYDIVTGEGEIGGSSQLLVKTDAARIINSGVIQINTPWWGPKGKRINGRAFPWAAVELDDGREVLVILAHLIWGPFRVRNWPAHVAELRALRRFIQARHGIDTLIMGDLNQPASRRGLGSMQAFARQIGGRIIHTGASVDYGIFRPAPRPHRLGRPVVIDGDVGSKFGSDHPSAYYSIGAAS
jgi:hypothetical protein